MADPFETNLDADEVATQAARLSLAATALKGALGEHVDRIREINTEAPWGDDETGNAFRASYLGTEAEHGNAAESIVTGSEDLCDLVCDLAENAGVGALTSQLVDEESGEELPRLLAQLADSHQQLRDADGEGRGRVGGGEPVVTG